MPMPLAAAAAIPIAAAAAGGLSNAFNAVSTAFQNRKQRKWNEKMYERQRADALADFNMQNEYNSPAAQMARLKEAGLNPNLVYKNGADNTGGPVRSSSVEGWKPQAPQVDASFVAPALSSIYDIQVKQAQVDNIKAATTVAAMEAALKAAQTVDTGLSAERKKFDLGLSKDLRVVSLETAVEGLRQLRTSIANLEMGTKSTALGMSATSANIDKTKAETERTKAETKRTGVLTSQAQLEMRLATDKNVREWMLARPTAAELLSRIAMQELQREKIPMEKAEIEQRIKNMAKELDLKTIEESLRKVGVNPNSQLPFPVIAKAVEKFISQVKKAKAEYNARPGRRGSLWNFW